MSEPRILVYHEWLVVNQQHFLGGISHRVWFNLQEYEPHPDAVHEFPEVYRRPESHVCRIVFELAYGHCLFYGPSIVLKPSADDGPAAFFLSGLGGATLDNAKENGGPFRVPCLSVLSRKHTWR